MNGGHGAVAEEKPKWALPMHERRREREHGKEEGEVELRAR
jgi:hypothetical protein